ncbi:DUF4870 domain-containing protein [Pontibacillus litoralis]|uniref:Chloroplast import component protein (Tic20) n=1 Tax=Pontibacillus litoralis JSM 072002 TaxID=1385512 RepID=A0A0A5G6C4_9BACI|nr:membrane protein [Pontibacillus litoralis]KGX87574.1 hypothetical protein N784_15110 [Pontibacillus litoralis JSM 072002]
METEQKPINGQKDIEEHKIMAILAYVIFFIPLLVAKESRFAMYHANQGLLLLIVAIGLNTIGSIIPVIGWLVIMPLGTLFAFVLFIIGIINASKGEMKPLPVIGKYTIIQLPDVK